jgi:hypothetical protein
MRAGVHRRHIADGLLGSGGSSEHLSCTARMRISASCLRILRIPSLKFRRARPGFGGRSSASCDARKAQTSRCFWTHPSPSVRRFVPWHLGEGPKIESRDLTLIASEPFANNSLRALIYADHRHLGATRFEPDNISSFEVISHEGHRCRHSLELQTSPCWWMSHEEGTSRGAGTGVRALAQAGGAPAGHRRSPTR